jgi:hypothetical protein
MTAGAPFATPANRARVVFLASVAATVVLYALPIAGVLARPLVWLATLIHELGHGVAALLVGGSFERLVIYADGSGIASHTGSHGAWARAFVAAGGLVGPAVGAMLGFFAARRPAAARWFLGATGAALVVAELLVIRNLFGFAFVALVAAALLACATKANPRLAQHVLVFLSVQLALSVYAGGGYLFTATAHTSAGRLPSDTAQIAEALAGPYWLWGGVCAAISVAALALGAWFLLRGERAPRAVPRPGSARAHAAVADARASARRM